MRNLYSILLVLIALGLVGSRVYWVIMFQGIDPWDIVVVSYVFKGIIGFPIVLWNFYFFPETRQGIVPTIPIGILKFLRTFLEISSLRGIADFDVAGINRRHHTSIQSFLTAFTEGVRMKERVPLGLGMAMGIILIAQPWAEKFDWSWAYVISVLSLMAYSLLLTMKARISRVTVTVRTTVTVIAAQFTVGAFLAPLFWYFLDGNLNTEAVFQNLVPFVGLGIVYAFGMATMELLIPQVFSRTTLRVITGSEVILVTMADVARGQFVFDPLTVVGSIIIMGIVARVLIPQLRR